MFCNAWQLMCKLPLCFTKPNLNQATNAALLVSLFTSGYRHIRLLSNTGEPLENSTLFVHVAITNKTGGEVSTAHIIL